jgi:hypothetical protein
VSSNTDEMLKKMRSDADPARPKGPAADPGSLYVRLIINKTRRGTLGLALAVGFALLWLVIARDQLAATPWWLTAMPVALVGLPFVLIAPSEDWEYKPWQTKARQYERHQAMRN